MPVKRCASCNEEYQSKKKDQGMCSGCNKTYQDNRNKFKQKQWVQRNIDKVVIYKTVSRAARRARINGTSGSFRRDDIIRLMSMHTECEYCGVSTIDRRHIDHIVPLAKGGSNNPINLQVLCPKCNLSKGSKLPWDFEASILYERDPEFWFNPELYSITDTDTDTDTIPNITQ